MPAARLRSKPSVAKIRGMAQSPTTAQGDDDAESRRATLRDRREDKTPSRELGLDDVTVLLQLADGGDEAAHNRLFDLVYAQLRERASRIMLGQNSTHTLQPTALVHEAYARLFSKRDAVQGFDSRKHFFAAVGAAMRHALVDYARYSTRARRDRGRVEALDEDAEGLAIMVDHETVLEVDEALQSFAEIYPDCARLVELKYFAGLTIPEIAAAQEISQSSAEKRWKFSRAWLLRKLGDESPPPTPSA